MSHCQLLRCRAALDGKQFALALSIGVCRTLLNPWHKKNAIPPLPRFDFSQYVLNNNMKFIEDENDSGYHITSFKIVFQAF